MLMTGKEPGDRRLDRLEKDFPRDPDLPELSVALDRGKMATLLQRRIFRDLGQVVRCRPIRFRYRRGERLIVSYEITLANPATGNVDSLLVTGRIRPRTLRHNANDRIETRKSPRITGDRSSGNAALIEELGMRIEIFPNDPRLPRLQELATPETGAARDIIARLTGKDTNLLTIAPLRYRPGLSATLGIACDAAPPEAAQSNYFLKVTSTPQADAEMRHCSNLNSALARSSSRLRLASPLGWDIDASIAIYEPAPGRSVEAMLIADEDAVATAAPAAQALADFHSCRVDGLPGGFASEVERKIDRALAHVLWATPEHGEIAEAVAALARGVTTGPVLAPTHRDMKPDHIFVCTDRQRVTFIDNGSLTLGNPLCDLGTLLVRLELLHDVRQLPWARIEALQRLLLSSYFERLPQGWMCHLPAAQAYGALLVATHAIQGLLPNWRALVGHTLSRVAPSSAP